MKRTVSEIWNDQTEEWLKEAGIRYKVIDQSQSLKSTEDLATLYDLSESAKTEIFSPGAQSLYYGHLDRPGWHGHKILNEIFENQDICIRYKSPDDIRLYEVQGRYASDALDCIVGGGKGVIFLKDLAC